MHPGEYLFDMTFMITSLTVFESKKNVLKMEILQRKWIPAMTFNLYLTHINKIAEKKSFVAAAHVNFFSQLLDKTRNLRQDFRYSIKINRKREKLFVVRSRQGMTRE